MTKHRDYDGFVITWQKVGEFRYVDAESRRYFDVAT